MADDEYSELMAELRAWSAQAKHGEQKDLAERLGVSAQRLNHWITGRNIPNLKDGLKLQTFLKAQRKKRPKP
ncbi:MAG TPA: helix-turn-helix transcriptional regulator [Chthoniobacterales bacterium]